MSYYRETSAENILKDVVISELNEFSCGAEVTSSRLTGFTLRKIFKDLIILAAAALLSLLFVLIPLFIVGLIIVIVDLVKYFNGNKLVYFIMSEAKKMPDKRISTIISEECIRGEPLPDGSPFREIKRKAAHWKKPLIITLCSVFGAAVVTGVVYLFVPITLYEDIEGGCAVVYARTGLASSAEVEPYHDGKAVVGIKSGAYKNNIFLNYIKLPDELTFIGGEAFMNCPLLQEITIPYKVTELRGGTFRGCRSLKTVTLHDDITAIHAFCFMDCENIVRITLPEGLTEIRESTFNNCTSLVAIDIPEGVTRIAARAFYNCDFLSVVRLPDSLTEIGSSAFRSCKRLTHIKIPNSCSINKRAFKESPTVIEYT